MNLKGAQLHDARAAAQRWARGRWEVLVGVPGKEFADRIFDDAGNAGGVFGGVFYQVAPELFISGVDGSIRSLALRYMGWAWHDVLSFRNAESGEMLPHLSRMSETTRLSRRPSRCRECWTPARVQPLRCISWNS